MQLSKITIARLLCSGAIVGIAAGNLLGVDFSSYLPTDFVTGVVGAGAAAAAMKIVHLL